MAVFATCKWPVHVNTLIPGSAVLLLRGRVVALNSPATEHSLVWCDACRLANNTLSAIWKASLKIFPCQNYRARANLLVLSLVTRLSKDSFSCASITSLVKGKRCPSRSCLALQFQVMWPLRAIGGRAPSCKSDNHEDVVFLRFLTTEAPLRPSLSHNCPVPLLFPVLATRRHRHATHRRLPGKEQTSPSLETRVRRALEQPYVQGETATFLFGRRALVSALKKIQTQCRKRYHLSSALFPP